MDQDATCYKVGHGPDDIVLDEGPSPHSPKKVAWPPNFRPMSTVATRSPISVTAELLLEVILTLSCFSSFIIFHSFSVFVHLVR